MLTSLCIQRLTLVTSSPELFLYLQWLKDEHHHELEGHGVSQSLAWRRYYSIDIAPVRIRAPTPGIIAERMTISSVHPYVKKNNWNA